jgi:hypothetical protein
MDMRTPGFTTQPLPLRSASASRSRGLGFECGGLICACSGDDDCNDLFTSGLCGAAVCFPDKRGGVVCVCLRQ